MREVCSRSRKRASVILPSDSHSATSVARGERIVHTPVLDDDGEWTYSDEWLGEVRAGLEARLDAADPLDPGIPAPTEPWAAQVLARLGYERRGAKLYRPGATPTLGPREREAQELESRLGLDPVKVEDRQLARFLEEQGRLVRVGDGLAISRDAYDRARAALVTECESAGAITLARLRDLLRTSRKTAQLLLERFDADGITRRNGDERVLRRAAVRSDE